MATGTFCRRAAFSAMFSAIAVFPTEGRAATGGLPRPYWYLWAGMLVTRAGSFVLPFLALYLTQGLHLSPAHAGLVGVLGGDQAQRLFGCHAARRFGIEIGF